jgi:prevent-host-death family protein
MATTATMRDLRNHTRAVIERAQSEAVTITDAGVPIAVLTAITSEDRIWNVDAWLETITGSDWTLYDSGLAAEIIKDRGIEDAEPDAVERLGLV